MAFSKGKEIKEQSFKRYCGVAPVRILAVNPNKTQLKEIFPNAEFNEEPSYITEVDVNGSKVKQVRIDFVVQTIAEKCGIDMISHLTYFINAVKRTNRDNTKVQIIDSFGRTSWATVDEFKEHKIPVDRNGNPLNINQDYRACYIGEEKLTNFIKTYLGIPNPVNYVNGVYVPKTGDELEDCKCRFDNFDNTFKGDFSEIIDTVALQPNQIFKVLFGVRHTDNGDFQTFYSDMIIKRNVNDYSRLEKDVKERQAAGSYPNTEFMLGQSVSDIQEYVVTPTDLEETKSDFDDNPWD